MLISLLAATVAVGPAQFAAATNPFGVSIFRRLAAETPDKNVLVSPLSISICLAMVAEGADGKTWSEMSKTLGVGSREDMNQGVASLMDVLRNADETTRMEIANALWANQSHRFESSFVQTLESNYGAQAKALDFSSPSAVPTMNKWVDEKTHGKITEIVDNLPADALMILMNAVSFKGDWVRKFEPRMSMKRPFAGAGDAVFMNRTSQWDYAESNGVQFLRMPYGNSRFSMEIALPAASADFEAFVKDVTAEEWAAWSKSAQTKQGSVVIPKWESEYKIELSDALKKMGMPDAFQPGANFTRMIKNHPAFIDLVNHKTYIKVDEKGTEAAAVTSAGIRSGSAMPPKNDFEFDANHPFVYAITEAETGALLFLGVVKKPNP
jgi:serpin B